MPSQAFQKWQNERLPRLVEVDNHCNVVASQVPPNPTFLDETLRGFVLHLSAHFQGFCRDLYTEAAQTLIATLPLTVQTAAQAQFFAQLTLEKGNPSYDNLKRDFNRFGLQVDLQAAHVTGSLWITALGQLNDWRNKAAHQGVKPLNITLSRPVVRDWQEACKGLAGLLELVMHDELLRIMGAPPW